MRTAMAQARRNFGLSSASSRQTGTAWRKAAASARYRSQHEFGRSKFLAFIESLRAFVVVVLLLYES